MRSVSRMVFAIVCALTIVTACSKSDGQEKPTGHGIQVFDAISLTLPVWMEQAPDDDAVWYAAEQLGTIVFWGDKKKTALDIKDRVLYGGEQGLLGFAFDPDFPKVPHIYVNYTSDAAGKKETRISRFVSKDGRTFDPKSETIILRFDQPYSNHNGGQVSFGPDGFLYIGIGDGGSGGDPKNHGQNRDTILGTIARIDVRGQKTYAIPKDNPFAKQKKGKEIWAWGLRNPWRFSWDSKTGDLWTGDVGQNAYEEIDIIEKGKNYGWNYYEGFHCYRKSGCPKDLKVEPPVFEYSQKRGDRSITGGYVYRGKENPTWVGKYIYGDFVSGRIWIFDPKTKTNALLVDSDMSISTFVQARDGELGWINYTTGKVYHLKGK